MLFPGELLACPKICFLSRTAQEKINLSALRIRWECVQSARHKPPAAWEGSARPCSTAQKRLLFQRQLAHSCRAPRPKRRGTPCPGLQPHAPPETPGLVGGVMDSIPKAGSERCPCQ